MQTPTLLTPEAPLPDQVNEADFQQVNISELRKGVELHMPIHDERMVLLLSEGQVINDSFLENLRKRGEDKVRVHKSEMPRVFAGKPQGESREVPQSHQPVSCTDRNDLTDQLDEWMDEPGELGLPPQGTALSESITDRGTESFDERRKQEFVERQTAAINQIDSTFTKLLRGDGLDLDGLSAITDEAMADLQDDMDLFVSLGVNPYSGGYPARHCMHTCMLAIAVGSHLQMDRATLKELGIGCLIHDSGMMMIDQSLAASPRKLTTAEMLEVSKHPVRIFDKMLSMQGIPRRSAFIAYQMHERPDGAGYPRRRKKEQIHFLSRVAAVADVYVALAAPRPHREGILPHAALKAITLAGNLGQLDQSAVHALLRTLSAYPLGSYVQLSDGRVGQVIRSNDLQFERPVVETWSRGELGKEPAVVDLAAEEELSILGPLASLSASYEPERNEAEGMRRAMEQLAAATPDNSAAPAASELSVNARRAFQTYVSLYVPTVNEHKSGTSWRKVTAVSRELAVSGMSVVTREEIRTPLMIAAFNARAGARICCKSRVDRQSQLPEGLWRYDISFIGKSDEPETSRGLGRL
jgi:HD-GYP domain-containing protein (c-di-GMP phosphodiesterase class II)